MPVSLSVDEIAVQLSNLERRYGRKKSLARILSGATARRQLDALADMHSVPSDEWQASPLGRPSLEGLWGEVSELTQDLLRIEPSWLRAACEAWTCGGDASNFVCELLVGPAGARACAARQAEFLAQRAACLRDPAPQRLRALVHATAAFAADLSADAAAFRRFMRELRAHARGPLELRAYGFGEISRPVGLVRRSSPLADTLAPAALVHKRLAPFANATLAARYVATYDEYNRRLRDDVGIVVPAFGHRTLAGRSGRIVVVTTQAALDTRSIGKAVMLRSDVQQCLILLGLVLAEYRQLVRYNAVHRSAGFAIGIDGQITNWAVCEYHDGVPLRGDEGLLYIDTNTPMMRTGGVDCLPMEFYLQALPRVARRLLRPLAKQVLDRYFNPRTIVLDFLANTSIHGRPELLDTFLPEGNAFLAEGLIEPAPRPITPHEVERYIAKDVATWRLTRSLRAVENMLQRQHGVIETIRRIHRIWTRPIF